MRCTYTLTTFPSSLNSTIVPLFEKILSASDASRIGRLVLPKACAEVSLLAYNIFSFEALKLLIFYVHLRPGNLQVFFFDAGIFSSY